MDADPQLQGGNFACRFTAAQTEQQERVEADGWEATLENVEGVFYNGRELYEVSRLVSDILNIPTAQLTRYHYRRLKKAMTALKWKGPVAIKMPSGKTAKAYWRTAETRSQRDNDDMP